jgi:DNA-binding MarR family transcriptional regulator
MTHGLDVTSLSGRVSDSVARLRRAMRRAARVRQPGMALSVAQLELLSVVEDHPASRPGDLATLLRLAPNSVSTLANALVAAGMLTRSSGSIDRRAVEYTLTARGAGQVGQWRTTNAGLLQSALQTLAARDLQVLSAALPVLDRLIAAINEQSEPSDQSGGGEAVASG